MLDTINNHKITKITKKVLYIKMQLILFAVLPLVVFTFLVSKTSILGVQSFIVLTGSMHPTIPPGAMVYVHEQDTFNPGDIVSFTNEANQTVTHRIARIEKNGEAVWYITKGDVNTVTDRSPVTNENVIGKVSFHIPYVGYVVNFIKTPLGFLGLIILPIIVFIGLEIWSIKTELEKQIEKRLLERLQTQIQ